jgi:peptide-methionine (S)-S-oxide reductase
MTTLLLNIIFLTASYRMDFKPEGIKSDTAVFGAGCFWCSEAVFQQLKGVQKVTPGYSGGTMKNPTYEDVCSGFTGHAEVVQIVFDPDTISFKSLLEIFFNMHDPTTLNRQGADEGTQYRSVIFYKNIEQKKESELYIDDLTRTKHFDSKIVTEINPLKVFYPAEDYHKNYFNAHKNKPYCQMVIQPKVNKIKMNFQDQLKEK